MFLFLAFVFVVSHGEVRMPSLLGGQVTARFSVWNRSFAQGENNIGFQRLIAVANGLHPSREFLTYQDLYFTFAQ